jgi:hypothetical protein
MTAPSPRTLTARLHAAAAVLTRQGTFPLAVLAVFLLCFGLFLPKIGFFWDDWVQLLSRHLYGFGAYMRYFDERPLSGWTHIVFGPLMGDYPLRWQVFTLSLRWGCVLAAWALFAALWPRYRRHAALAALVFAVYPGFTQQPISVAYHQHWLQYLLFLLSLLLMVQSRRCTARRGLWLAGALLCQLLQLSITEFFTGVELLRPVLLWLALGEPVGGQLPLPSKRRLWAALRAWLPYLAVLLAYSIWRLFFFDQTGRQNTPGLIYSLGTEPAAALLRLGRYAAIDALNVLLAVWGKVFDLRLASFNQPVILFSWAAGLLAAIGLGTYLAYLQPAVGEEDSPPVRTSLEWIWVGLLGVLLGPVPLWAADQNILWAVDKDVYHSDRFTLAAMLWASLLLVGVLSWAVQRWKAKALLVAALVGLLVGFQVRNANDYRWLSVDQLDFYWQLAWRAPSLQPGTALITEDILFPYQGLFADSSAVNLLYPQPQNPENVAYWIYSIRPRYEDRDPLAAPASFKTHVRLFTFAGQTPNSLLISYGAPKANCLWVLRPADVDFPDLTTLQKKWLAVSSLGRIGSDPAATGYPSATLFGPPPEQSWCYFYEKADLARQFGDWPAAAALGDQARAKGFRADRSGSNSMFEWMPFIEAYAHQARWADAASLSLESLAFDPDYAPFLCSRWKALAAAVPDGAGREDALQKVSEAAACAP